MSLMGVLWEMKVGHIINMLMQSCLLWLAKHKWVERFLKCHCFLTAQGSGKV